MAVIKIIEIYIYSLALKINFYLIFTYIDIKNLFLLIINYFNNLFIC